VALHGACAKRQQFGICVMTNAKKTKIPDLSRREALKRLGLAVGAAYMTPTLFSLSNAQASSTSSGGGGDSGGSGSGGTSSTSAASSPSSSVDNDEFSGDPTPVGGDLSADDELLLIKNGWQKTPHK
jgi:hypothetical protein